MIAQIKDRLNTGFEQELFSASLENLENSDNPLCLNNFAYSMRELIRHILNRLAPDKNVLQCSWYTNETDKKNGITRSQRAYYAVQGGLSDQYIENTLEIEVKEIHKKLIYAINQLSKFTHIEEDTFNISFEDINKYSNETIKSIFDFLMLIDVCRNEIIEHLFKHIDEAAIDEVLKETIESLAVLASHHYIDEVYTDTIEIYAIDHETIFFKAIGEIGCELQWGSNGDIRRGDGHIARRTFSFDCELKSPVEEPDAVESVEDSLRVDTGDMYGDIDDEI